MNSKMTTNSQLSTNEPKKQKLSKQIEQEQNHRNGDHREGYQWGGGEWEKKVQGIKSVIAGHKIDKERSTMVEETENSKNLYVQPMDMN